jgi:hypothetical protein
MIKLDTDEPISDTDYELIDAFSVALIDKDTYAMKEVMYLVSERLASSCICGEEKCICRNW